MEPTYALEDELSIEIDWWPFTLDIGSYLGSARLGHEGKVVENERSTGQWAKVKYAYHDVRRYGSMRGRIIRGAVKMWDSSIPGIGMLWARELVGRGRPRRAASEDSRGLPGTRGGLRGGSWSRAEQARSTPEFDVILGPIESADS
jgi:hypothetical protein